MMSAMSSRFMMMRSNQRRKIWARSFGNAFAQGPKARAALSIAPTASAWPKRGTLAMSAPVAGLSIGSTPSPTHFPSTRHLSLSSEGSASFIGGLRDRRDHSRGEMRRLWRRGKSAAAPWNVLRGLLLAQEAPQDEDG